MQFTSAEINPTPSIQRPHVSDDLIIKTIDGKLYHGYAMFCNGELHTWFVRNGGNTYSIGCFHDAKVIGWAVFPSLETIVEKC